MNLNKNLMSMIKMYIKHELSYEDELLKTTKNLLSHCNYSLFYNNTYTYEYYGDKFRETLNGSIYKVNNKWTVKFT
jgi:uncharacterized protein with von Willebrand factor type A (vWA) domain